MGMGFNAFALCVEDIRDGELGKIAVVENRYQKLKVRLKNKKQNKNQNQKKKPRKKSTDRTKKGKTAPKTISFSCIFAIYHA